MLKALANAVGHHDADFTSAGVSASSPALPCPCPGRAALGRPGGGGGTAFLHQAPRIGETNFMQHPPPRRSAETPGSDFLFGATRSAQRPPAGAAATAATHSRPARTSFPLRCCAGTDPKDREQIAKGVHIEETAEEAHDETHLFYALWTLTFLGGMTAGVIHWSAKPKKKSKEREARDEDY